MMGVAPVYSGEWQLMSETPFHRKWIMATGPTQFVVKTETLSHSLQAEDNAAHYNASEGKRWGEGQVVARVPLDVYFGKVMPMKLAGDTTGLKRFYNDPDNRHWRTFKGRI